MSARLRLTDLMLHTDDVERAKAFWVGQLGLTLVSDEPAWTMLEDPDSGQRLVLTPNDFGAPWALALSAPNLFEECKRLSEMGLQTEPPVETLSTASTHALVRVPDGPPLLVYSDG